MANIPTFKNIPQEEFLDTLTAVLIQLNKDANGAVDFNLGKNVVIDWVDDGKTPLPRGYEVADGSKGTFDANSSKIIKIQKVK